MTASTATAPDLAPTASRPDAPARRSGSRGVDVSVTGLTVIGPFIALAIAIPLLWGRLVSVRDLAIAAALYAVSGLGIAVGYHRLFTHRAFTANRPLKIALAAAGSMAVEGSVIGWAANHRRHHRFSDRPGDPHSPNLSGTGPARRFRGMVHAHVGWLFREDGTDPERYVADLMADRDLVLMGRLWGVFAVGSLVVPFGLGWVLSGTLTGAVVTFLWAGVVRMALLHHVTWSINSVCHTFGRRPFRTRDGSRNVAALSVLSFGESFHNLHHAYPVSARHGVLPHQVDLAAATIKWFERAGWATDVHWPEATRLVALRTGGSAPAGPPSARRPSAVAEPSGGPTGRGLVMTGVRRSSVDELDELGERE
ncbi:acyl-CoA desaturase [Dermatobacter hominis]|uniref:acyl-CoA desaturase n=1 Tax=Dermatobacter hominis TaxID=2884263 RepID=UPI001D11D508|nr:acyl-CoA desaturase [Dermatobacter hominis]UDY34968.1 acyl-CoA desaturase [Dermatobacter hominis]